MQGREVSPQTERRMDHPYASSPTKTYSQKCSIFGQTKEPSRKPKETLVA